mmetsp:Transcript_41264/g.78862  ORF Transcript_41264/g.78862 Transcript_41264/m.78862 type:complete len:143 (-) Transcript_41264:166-594(-)|eukprot:CAMPEP_0114233060 /NCGR_PEP_ID=MMETSP0058-20121206/4951_1 /TAXON_ID=36894 /ORGANISM="Pyramimonas parkeae, CCMP726" /LENGTH=142 /DNA_ID=CAMNT_0001344601 /DNA_START=306 /DNA_END=734 /DNA_ORIENTATION=+
MAKRPFSSNLLGLKFMQRAAEKDRRVELKQEEDKKAEQSKWVAAELAAGSRKCKVIVEGTTPAPGAIMGRMSFKNFNPEVEALVTEKEVEKAKLSRAAQLAAGGVTDGVTVTDSEMANRLGKCSSKQDEPRKKKRKKDKKEG